MRLMIGTAQFGVDYGINGRQRNTDHESRHIVELAHNNGIDWVDTSREYGTSENVLGSITHDRSDLSVVTKTAIRNPDVAETMFLQSLTTLNVPRVEGLLVHNADDTCSKELFDRLYQLKQQGFVKSIGASVYTTEEAMAVTDKYPIDIIQVPCSIVDQRFIQTGTIDKLASKGIRVHIRSVFLQGLLLMRPQSVMDYFLPMKPHLSLLQRSALDNGISVLSLVLGYVKSLDNVDKIIVGVHDVQQLEEIICAYHEPSCSGIDFDIFSMDDTGFIDPRNWVLGNP